jgi:hypothetical protein
LIYDVQSGRAMKGLDGFLLNTTEISTSLPAVMGRPIFSGYGPGTGSQPGTLQLRRMEADLTTVLTSPAPVLVTSYKYSSPSCFKRIKPCLYHPASKYRQSSRLCCAGRYPSLQPDRSPRDPGHNFGPPADLSGGENILVGYDPGLGGSAGDL